MTATWKLCAGTKQLADYRFRVSGVYETLRKCEGKDVGVFSTRLRRGSGYRVGVRQGEKELYFSLESEATQVAWRNAAASRGVRVTYSEESGRRACEGILGHGNGTDIFFAGNFSLPLGGRWYVRWALRHAVRS